jgi:V/A-type H+-transporting ATPase subunit I
MIIPMEKIRLLGPRTRLGDLMAALQDAGVLHLADATRDSPLKEMALTPRQERMRRQLQRALEDIDAALGALHAAGKKAERAAAGDAEDFARAARRARRARHLAESISIRTAALAEERALILKYRDFFAAFESALAGVARFPHLTTYAVVVPAHERGVIPQLGDALRKEIGPEFAISTHDLASGDVALLLVMPKTFADRIEHALADARLPEIPMPAAYGGGALAETVPKMLERLKAIPRDAERLAQERAALAAEHAPGLLSARGPMHDCLNELDAIARCGVTAHAFAVEGWLPVTALPKLEALLATRFAGAVVLERIAREQWTATDAPVVLSNPRIFRPFEAIVRVMPLPAYGTIDPTPFVAVFFPAMFGIMLGDVGYGIMLLALGLIVRHKSRADTMLRSVGEMAIPMSVFTIIFGFLYGEFFGDLGQRLFGMKPILFDRAEGVVAALALAVGLGIVHVVLGLVLGALSARHSHPKHAVGKGITAVMVLLIVAALLAAFEVLPKSLFVPVVIALLVAFPLLILTEGLLAPLELLSSVGNALSYARIMALGTASVMLAAVANRMVGALGSIAVGLVFALLFHLVNFAIGLFGPTIHALRLHYVEFFGKFYSPGGLPYHPLTRWHSGAPR